MPSRTSPSPSPPPAAPTALTPGVRAAALQDIFTKALTATLKANSYANFSACFPTPARHCPNALEGVWRQLNTKLEEGCKREFEAICKEKNVVEGLNEWDRRMEEAIRARDRAVEGERPEKPLHALSAEELFGAHLAPFLQEATQILEARLQSSQEENRRLMEQVMEQRREVERMVQGLEAVVKDVEGSVAVLGTGAGTGRAVDGLRAEVWEMEAEAGGAAR